MIQHATYRLCSALPHSPILSWTNEIITKSTFKVTHRRRARTHTWTHTKEACVRTIDPLSSKAAFLHIGGFGKIRTVCRRHLTLGLRGPEQSQPYNPFGGERMLPGGAAAWPEQRSAAVGARVCVSLCCMCQCFFIE